MKSTIKLFDVVALKQKMPEKDLQLGQVGTVVEILAPDVYEVEFTDNNGHTLDELLCELSNCWCCIMSQRLPEESRLKD
jgi:hypothetical protein